MKKGKNNTAEAFDSDYELDDIGLEDNSEHLERTLILKGALPSRRAQLLAQGVMEIRCTVCKRVKPLAGAEESDEGWMCEGCAAEITQRLKLFGQKRR